MNITITTHRFFLLIVVTMALSACTITPKIEKKYDELSKNTVCRLRNYCLKNAWGRPTFINVEKDGNGIRTILQVTGIDHAYDFRNNPSIAFDLYHNNQIIEQIKVNTKTIDIKDWNETINSYINGMSITTTVHYSTASSLIPLTINDFKKIANAEIVHFLIIDNRDSIKGKLTTKDLEWFKQFDSQCMVSD